MNKEIILKVENQNGDLFINASDTTIGHQFDNLYTELQIKRPPELADADLMLVFNSETEEFQPEFLYKENHYVIPDALLSPGELWLQLRFYNGRQKVGTAGITFYIGKSLNPGEVDTSQAPDVIGDLIKVGSETKEQGTAAQKISDELAQKLAAGELTGPRGETGDQGPQGPMPAIGQTTSESPAAVISQSAVTQLYVGLQTLLENEKDQRKVDDDELRTEMDVLNAKINGLTTGYVFDTLEDMNEALQDPEFVKKLKAGFDLYIRDLDVPDYWWDGEQAIENKAPKADLSNYYNKDDVLHLIAESLSAANVYTDDLFAQLSEKLNSHIATPDYYSEDPKTTAAAARVIVIPGINSTADMLDKTYKIKSGTYGTSGKITLKVNDFSPIPLYFTGGDNTTLTDMAIDNWVSNGQLYEVYYNGSRFAVTNINGVKFANNEELRKHLEEDRYSNMAVNPQNLGTITGRPSTLQTTAKNTLVDAINEVNAKKTELVRAVDEADALTKSAGNSSLIVWW